MRPRAMAAAAAGLALAGCHLWTAEPAPLALVGEPFYQSANSRGMGWSGSEFVEVRPVSPQESLEMPRAVYAIHVGRTQRSITTFLLPGYILHVPLGVFGGGLYVKIAASGGDYHLVRFALTGGGRDTIAHGVPVHGLVVSPDERFVVYTRPGTSSVVADSVVVHDRTLGAVTGFRHPGAVALLEASPDAPMVALAEQLADAYRVSTMDLTSGALQLVASIPTTADQRLTVWRSLAWRATGPRLAYVTSVGSQAERLWVVDQPGSNPRLLAQAGASATLGSGVLTSNLHPLAWLDGGQRLALIHNTATDRATTVGVISVTDGFLTVLGTGGRWVFPPVEQNVWATTPSLYPDGTSVLVRDFAGFRSVPLF